MHSGNLLFKEEDLNIIDFDNLGWGFWIYDLAAALAFELKYEGYENKKAALLDGYREICDLSSNTDVLLSLFLQFRVASVAIWLIFNYSRSYAVGVMGCFSVIFELLFVRLSVHTLADEPAESHRPGLHPVSHCRAGRLHLHRSRPLRRERFP